MAEDNKSFGTNSTGENIAGTLAAALAGFILFKLLYDFFWKHFTTKQKVFVLKMIFYGSWVWALTLGFLLKITGKT